MKEKWIAGLLTMALVFSLLPWHAAAAEEDVPDRNVLLQQAEGVYTPYPGASYSVLYDTFYDVTPDGHLDFDKKIAQITGWQGTAQGPLVLPSILDGLEVREICAGAFENCSGFTGTPALPSKLRVIGDSAFSGCSGLTGDLLIPDSVTEIGNWAFADCTGLNGKLQLPQALQLLGMAAFRNCSSLTGALLLPQGITSLGLEAFQNCKRLTGSVHWPAGVSLVEQSVFSGCSGLDGTLTLPEGVTQIHRSAFANCSGLKGPLLLPASLTTLEDQAFSACSGFTDLQIAPGNDYFVVQDQMLLTKDGKTLLYGLPSRQGTLTIPSSVTAIADNAFRSCTGLTGTVFLPASVTGVGKSSFAGCTGLTQFRVAADNPQYSAENGLLLNKNGTSLLSGLAGMAGSCVIPAGVSSIGDFAFSGCAFLDGSLTIPSSVSTIGRFAFSDCRGLDGSLVLSEGLQEIQAGAFQNCRKLTGDLVLPDSLTVLDNVAFDGCSSLGGTLILGSGLSMLGANAFRNCSALQTIQLPRSIHMIGTGTFSGCSGLQTVQYEGTEQQWNGISVDPVSNAPLLEAHRQYNTAPTKRFQLTYLPDGGTGDLPAPQTYEEGAVVSITSVIPVREGRTFLGWSDGSRLYHGGDALTISHFSITLTALWDGPFRPYPEASYELVYEELADGGLKITGYTGYPQGQLQIPATINLQPVRIIGAGAFKNCSQFHSPLRIPASVTEIQEEAFYHCTMLYGYLVLQNVRTIGASAFEWCPGLEGLSLDMTNSVELGDSAFAGCTGLSGSLDLQHAAVVGRNAFHGCTGLNGELIIGSLPRSIGPGALADCPGITQIFVSGTQVPTLTLQNGMLLSPDQKTLLYCPAGLTGPCSIPETVTVIQDGAFSACAGLTGTLHLPAGLTQLETLAFGDCVGIEALELAADHPTYSAADGMLLSKDGNTLLFCPRGKAGPLRLPSNLTAIDSNAFAGCTKLTGPLTIPDGVKVLGVDAFRGCTGLTGTADTGSGLSVISSGAFRGCTGISQVVLSKTLTVIDRWAFDGCSSLQTVAYQGSPQMRSSIRIAASNAPLTTAVWTCSEADKAPGFLVSYDTNGGSGSFPDVTVPGGTELRITSAIPKKPDHTFCGWSDGQQLYKASQSYPMPMHDVVLQAVWEQQVPDPDAFLLGRDNNSFIHNNTDPGSGFFGIETCSIPYKLYRKLTSYALNSEIQAIKYTMHQPWGGSCYGIASTMAMVHEGSLLLTDISDSGAADYYHLPKPYVEQQAHPEKNLLDSINYYQLSQFIVPDYAQAGRIFNLPDHYAPFFTTLFSYLDEERPVVLGYHTERGGHAILVCDYEQLEDGSYAITLYDENSVTPETPLGSFWYMYVSADKQNFSYRQPYETITNRNCEGLSFCCVDDLEGYIEKPYLFSAEPYEEMTVTFPMDADYTLTLADGQTLTYDSETGVFSGSVLIRRQKIFMEDDSSRWMLSLPASPSLEASCSNGSLELSVRTQSEFAALSGQNIAEASFTLGESILLQPVTGRNSAFEAALSTDVFVSKQETNLISVEGVVSGATTIAYDRQAQEVCASSSSPIDQALAFSMVEAERVPLADLDPASQVVTVSAAYVPDEFCSVDGVKAQNISLYLRNQVPGTCMAAVYDSTGRMLTVGSREVPAHAGAVQISFQQDLTIDACQIQLFFLDQDNRPLYKTVQDRT